MIKFYTKTNARHGFFQPEFFSHLSKFKHEPGSVFWYDQHDASTRRTPFNRFLNEEAWAHLKHDPTSKILIFYGDEYYNILDLIDWVTTCKKYQVKPEQLYILCLDENWEKWTKQKLLELEFPGVNIQEFNLLMSRVSYKTSEPFTLEKRFSMFSRNYGKWRLKLYLELLNQDLLSNFTYTFNNVMPYANPVVTISKDHIKEEAITMNCDRNLKVDSWIDNMPYTLDDHVTNKLSDELYRKIKQSGINIIVESHFDPFWNFGGHRGKYTPQDFSPAFPTEKTYKPITCKTPFIIFSTPYFLKEFRQMGYRTFHPYIDESYDLIEDNVQRLDAIVKEVDRISKLSENEFNILLENCNKAAQYNHNLMIKKKYKLLFNPEFQWLIPCIDKNFNYHREKRS